MKVYYKYLNTVLSLSGAKDLEDISRRLDNLSEYFLILQDNGVKISYVYSNSIRMTTTDPEVAEKFNFADPDIDYHL